MPIKPIINFFKNPFARSIFFAILTAAIVLLFIFNSDLLNTFELRTLDYRFILRGNKKVESDISVVFIGNDDINDIGKWPWPRYYHAFLVDALKKHGVDQIGYDILFTDPSEGEAKEHDLVFALAAKDAGNVNLISFFDDLNEVSSEGKAPTIVDEGPLPTALEEFSFELKEGQEEYFLWAKTHEYPIRVLLNGESGGEESAVKSVGYANCLPDSDGVTRKVPLLVNYNGRLYMSLPLAIVVNYLRLTKDDIEINPGESIALKKGNETYTIPIDDNGEMIVNYNHMLSDFDAYSFNQLLQSDRYPDSAIYDLSRLKDKIVIIGTSYTGGTDLRSTPLDPAYPLMCLQATVIDNILSRDFIYRPSVFWRVLIIIFFCFLINFICSYTTPSVNFLVITSIALIYLYITYYIFIENGVMLDAISPLMAISIPYILLTTVRYIFALFENIRYLERMKYLGNLVESSHDAIFSLDLDGRINSWNSGAKQIYGYEVDEILNKSWEVFAPPDKEESLLEIIKKAKSGISTTNHETNLITKEGHVIIVNISVSPIIGSKGETSGVSIISQDLTERKRLMEQIMESEKLAEIGRLSAGLAHEIKNPLTPIIFYAQSLEEAEEVELEDIRSKGEIISSEASRILNLAKDLLSFSRPKDETMVPVDINKVVEDTVLLVIYQARKIGAETIKELGENLPKFRGEPDKLKQVLINLVMNAAQAMGGKKGEVKLITRDVNEDGKKFVEVAVEDNGSGMPAHVKENLFKPFFTTKPKGVGTGLGLYISYNIIKQFDGTITVESEDGVGTTFLIRIPAMEE